MVKSIYFKKFSNAMDILKGAHLGGSRGAHAPLLFLPLPEIIAIRALIFLPRPKIIYISAVHFKFSIGSAKMALEHF